MVRGYGGVVAIVVAATLVGAVGPLVATAAAAGSMNVTNVFYDPPSGPIPGCTASLPGKGGAGTASYDEPGGAYKVKWEWTVPATITAGATAKLKLTVDSFGLGGYQHSAAFKTPSEFGINAGARSQIFAGVPVGQTGTSSDEENYTFTPNRDFVTGEKLYIRLETGCVAFIYEYIGTGPPPAAPPPPAPPPAAPAPAANPCAGTSLALAAASPVATIAAAPCKSKELATPAPGRTTRASSPTPFGADAKTGVTVTDSGGSLGGTTIVGEGGNTFAGTVGEEAARCWLLGPDALSIPSKFGKAAKEDLAKAFAQAADDPRKTLVLCIILVRVIAEHIIAPKTPPVVGPSAAGCSARGVTLGGRMRRGKVVGLTLQRSVAPGSVRYTCARVSAGQIRINVDGRKAGGLRRQLGDRLDLGVVRGRKAARTTSRLTFGFGG